MKSPNYNLKARVLSTDLPKILNNLKYHTYHGTCSPDFLAYSHALIDSVYSADEVKEGYRILNNNYHKIKKLRTRIEKIIQNRSFFLTLTFTDSVLIKTNQVTRRKYVQRFLKSISSCYVANIDYGEKKGREHYHAVVLCDNIDHNGWSYGAINFELISFKHNTSDKLSKYINKLSNHAIKETTKRNYLIYSRK